MRVPKHTSFFKKVYLFIFNFVYVLGESGCLRVEVPVEVKGWMP